MSLHPTCTHTLTLTHTHMPALKRACAKTHAHSSCQVRLLTHTYFPTSSTWYTHTCRGVVYCELTGGLNGSECLLNEMGEGGRPGGDGAYKEMKWLALIWPHKDVNSSEPRVASAWFRLRWRSDLSCVWEAVTQWQTGLWLPLLLPDHWQSAQRSGWLAANTKMVSFCSFKLTDLTPLGFFSLSLPVLLLSLLSCSHFHKVKVPPALKPQQSLLMASC